MNHIPIELELEMLQPGDYIQSFRLEDHTGGIVDTDGLLGRPFVLWWYPQAMGAGCTQCARAFRDYHSKFLALGGNIIGMSFSSKEANAHFAKTNNLHFPLVHAPAELARDYGAERRGDEPWAGLPRRIAYLVNANGEVHKNYFITGDPQVTIRQVYEDFEEIAKDREPVVPEYDNPELEPDPPEDYSLFDPEMYTVPNHQPRGVRKLVGRLVRR